VTRCEPEQVGIAEAVVGLERLVRPAGVYGAAIEGASTVVSSRGSGSGLQSPEGDRDWAVRVSAHQTRAVVTLR